MATLKEQMEARMQERPDKHTIAWWQDQFDQVTKGYRGLTHACNVVLSQLEDRDEKVKTLEERVESLTEEIREAKVAIGKLQSEYTTSMSKVREAYAELKKKVGS